MLFHYCQMNGITRREALVDKDNLFCAFDNRPVDRQDFVDHAQKGVEGGLNIVAEFDRDVAMQDFPQHLGIGHQALALTDQSFQQALGIGLEGTGCTHEIHWDIGVNQNHGLGPAVYPRSISASMVSMSEVGDSCRAAARMASSFFSTSPRG